MKSVHNMQLCNARPIIMRINARASHQCSAPACTSGQTPWLCTSLLAQGKKNVTTLLRCCCSIVELSEHTAKHCCCVMHACMTGSVCLCVRMATLVCCMYNMYNESVSLWKNDQLIAGTIACICCSCCCCTSKHTTHIGLPGVVHHVQTTKCVYAA